MSSKTDPRDEGHGPAPLDTRKLTWAVLLGRWVEFARSAVALPQDAAGRKLRASVPDLIMLQAVWFALGELGELEPGERALGIDRAAVLIAKHEAALRQRWGRAKMPKGLVELIGEARGRLGSVQQSREAADERR